MSTIRVLLVDDHDIVRSGLRALLAGVDGIEVVGSAVDGQDALRQNADLAPDVVLMDLQMPEMGGVAAIARLHQDPDPPAVVVVTVHETDSGILAAIEAGATGYLLKDTPGDEIVAAIRAAHRGEPVLSPEVTRRLMRRSRRPVDRTLTLREIEILTHVAEGKSNRSIAAALYLSEATIKSHLNHVYAKLEVENRTGAVAAAIDQGIL